MYIVRKIFKFPIGHRLMKHEGLCKNIHGHNLKIEVQVSSKTLSKNDMVIDFKDLKTIVNDILKEFDHCTIFNTWDEENIEYFQKHGYKFTCISSGDADPTAEMLSRYLFKSIRNKINNTKRDDRYGAFYVPQIINVDFVRVWENDDSMAEYREI